MDIIVTRTSALITDADVVPVIAAINHQIVWDFAPKWQVSGTLYLNSGPTGAARCSLQDTIDDPDALGYHVDENGLVEMIIDVEACQSSGDDWRTCLGHEALETLVDSLCNLMGLGAYTSFIREVCDAVEEDFYPGLGGVPVTNFVLPSYFGIGPVGPPWDMMGQLSGPAPALRPGGYIDELTGGAWTMHLGDRADGYMATRKNGRRAWRKRS
jgi:hypothetical protein